MKEYGSEGCFPLNEIQCCFKHTHAHLRKSIPREPAEGLTCAVRHAFASSIDRLLALLLGSLELTVFTARAVPVTAEAEQTEQFQSNVSPTANTTVMSAGPADGGEGPSAGPPDPAKSSFPGAGPPAHTVCPSCGGIKQEHREVRGDSTSEHLGVLGFH